MVQSKEYYSNGQLKTRGHLCQRPRSMVKLNNITRNGKPQLVETWVKGQKEGDASYYHNNGKLAEQGTYLRDRKEGLWQKLLA